VFDAVAFAKSHAERHGHALTTANLIKDKRNQMYRLDIRYNKRGKKRGEGIVRKTSTRMAECPFKLRRFRIDPKSGHWKITAVFDGSHNHQAADKPELQLLQLISNTDQAKLMAKTSQ
jgi:hypothetical protein